jgi:hypothetical protein
MRQVVRTSSLGTKGLIKKTYNTIGLSSQIVARLATFDKAYISA